MRSQACKLTTDPVLAAANNVSSGHLPPNRWTKGACGSPKKGFKLPRKASLMALPNCAHAAGVLRPAIIRWPSTSYKIRDTLQNEELTILPSHHHHITFRPLSDHTSITIRSPTDHHHHGEEQHTSVLERRPRTPRPQSKPTPYLTNSPSG